MIVYHSLAFINIQYCKSFLRYVKFMIGVMASKNQHLRWIVNIASVDLEKVVFLKLHFLLGVEAAILLCVIEVYISNHTTIWKSSEQHNYVSAFKLDCSNIHTSFR